MQSTGSNLVPSPGNAVCSDSQAVYSNSQSDFKFGFDFTKRDWSDSELESDFDQSKQSPVTSRAMSRWNTSGKLPRISAVKRAPKTEADVERLHHILEEARIRETLRITARMPSLRARPFRSEALNSIFEKMEDWAGKLKFQLQIVQTYFSHYNNVENYCHPSEFPGE